MQRRD